jgi:SAM-dependent methyltransferase
MSVSDRQAHWEKLYSTKAEREVSWFQESPSPSLDLLRLAGAVRETEIIDIGGGPSRLVDALVERGFERVTVLDLSEAALAMARSRLGEKAGRVQWIAADVTQWNPTQPYDIWHDRAAFHFLTAAADQEAYLARLRRALPPGGHAIIGTFALDGPEKCSGLPVVRRDAASLGRLLGEEFLLIDERRHEHVTPWGATQPFQFSTFRRRA